MLTAAARSLSKLTRAAQWKTTETRARSVSKSRSDMPSLGWDTSPATNTSLSSADGSCSRNCWNTCVVRSEIEPYTLIRQNSVLPPKLKVKCHLTLDAPIVFSVKLMLTHGTFEQLAQTLLGVDLFLNPNEQVDLVDAAARAQQLFQQHFADQARRAGHEDGPAGVESGHVRRGHRSVGDGRRTAPAAGAHSSTIDTLLAGRLISISRSPPAWTPSLPATQLGPPPPSTHRLRNRKTTSLERFHASKKKTQRILHWRMG